MIPIYFREGEIDFTTNGFGRLADCISCKVTEERNGIFELEMQYPITGEFYEQLLEGGTIGAIHDDKHDVQAFDIYRHSAPIDGIVTFNAHHVSYRLNRVIVQPFTALSASDAMAQFKTQAVTQNPFTFWTDKSASGSFKVKAPANIRSLLGGTDGSILDVFGGGDYEFDLFTVKLHQSRGVDSGVTIRYGKNLTEIEHEKDDSFVFNSCAPYWIGGEDQVVFLPEIVVYSPNAPLKLYPWTDENGNQITDENGEPIYFQTFVVQTLPLDLSTSFESAPTEDQLRQAALSYMAKNQTWIPDENITINFVQLWQTEEYESVAALQRVSLCDRVSVYYPELGVVAACSKVIMVVYDVLLERYEEIELGKVQTTLAQAIAGGIEQQIQNVPSVSMMRSAIDKATDLITGGLGGYVVMNADADGHPQEILVMDTPDIMTAVHVIRINRNGIGFSNNGYEGPFESAWTIDGSFNANFITAGVINADLIRAGTIWGDLIRTGKIVSNNGRVYFDLDNNELHCDTLVSTGEYASAYIARIGRAYQGGDGTASGGGFAINGMLIQQSASGAHSLAIVPGSDTAPTELATGFEGLAMLSHTRQGGGTRDSGGAGFVVTPNGYVGIFGQIKNYSGINSEAVLRQIISQAETPTSTSAGSMMICIEPSTIGSGTSYVAANGVYMKGRVYTGPLTADAISVSGTKSRRAKVDEFGERLLYCYETPSPLFGDIGEGQIDETGTCYVFLDPVFAESISCDKYQVFLQKYGDGDCWVEERKPGYFVVSGTPGLFFGWELKAKQKDFDQIRMEDASEKPEIIEDDYGLLAAIYYEELTEGRMTA